MTAVSQFVFLPQSIQADARQAEAAVLSDARASCFYARRTLELVVEWLYTNDPDLERPWETHLAALLATPSFQQQVPPHIVAKAKLIKNLGNGAVHGKGQVKQFDALTAIRELFHVSYWFARTYSKDFKHEGAQFDQAKLPVPVDAAKVAQKSAEQLKALEAQLHAKDEELAKTKAAQLAASAELEEKLAAAQKEVAAAKAKAALLPDPHDYSEAETRDRFIDLMLREAGWGLSGWKDAEDIEVEVDGMPNAEGKGYVDYVLWGDNGLPLAVVEAKRTTKSPQLGKQQAKLYADCLEAKHGRRPIIYYTNGYETWVWDDQHYPPRSAQGFHTKDELELLIERRKTRKPLGGEPINSAIVERYYQIEAIREVGKRLQTGHRKGLVVMATGAGKTRTVIALVDLLQRCNWVKRVLFLADRKALVNQAINAFKKHLPGSSPVNLLTDKISTGRVYVSTYPTILNLIDEMGPDGVTRRFGAGHFDLVVIDEAHRSVYQKYRAIFEYFDSFLLGLTATPRGEVDRDTYGLFDLQAGLPTYSYDLEQAVKDCFLVPFKAVSVPLKFQREGIRYEDLPESEKEQWDAVEWDEEGNVPDRIEAEAVNKWLFNKDTVDKVLAHLMDRGIKVAGGDRLGKTIIFAKNKDHARFIEERFDKHYPQFKGQFARLIVHDAPYAQSLLDDFSAAEKAPHIAVSVDMLDTGIDVPEVVNLVFFKLIRSKTKFFQMIGRGTRLCKDLFGPGQDKTEFFIFDFCQNLEFFSQNPSGVDGSVQPSLSATLFRHRLDLHHDLGATEQEKPTKDGKQAKPTKSGTKASNEPEKKESHPDKSLSELRGEVADVLHAEVVAMNVENFLVRLKRRKVEAFKERKAWEELTADQYAELHHDVAGLPSELPTEDETAKRFDLLMLKVQLAVLNHDRRFVHLREQVQGIAGKLQEKKDVPMVNAEMALILDLQSEEWWADVTLPMLESARKRVRDLVKFIDKAQRQVVYTDFEDEIGSETQVDLGGMQAVIDQAAYRRRVERFIQDQRDHITISKLRSNKPLGPADLEELERLLFETGDLGNLERLETVFGKQESLGLFIRRLVGLDREAAKQVFGDYLNGSLFNADQIRFVNFIIDYLTKGGVMEPERLYETPCTEIDPAGLDGVFGGDDANKIISLLEQVRRNAVPQKLASG